MNATITINDQMELRLLAERLERQAQDQSRKQDFKTVRTSEDQKSAEVIRRILKSVQST